MSANIRSVFSQHAISIKKYLCTFHTHIYSWEKEQASQSSAYFRAKLFVEAFYINIECLILYVRQMKT